MSKLKTKMLKLDVRKIGKSLKKSLASKVMNPCFVFTEGGRLGLFTRKVHMKEKETYINHALNETGS